jgi:hypothetical protein
MRTKTNENSWLPDSMVITTLISNNFIFGLLIGVNFSSVFIKIDFLVIHH